jgi:hypothetical protein
MKSDFAGRTPNLGAFLSEGQCGGPADTGQGARIGTTAAVVDD